MCYVLQKNNRKTTRNDQRFVMYYGAELVLKNYIPETISPGMRFVNVLYPGTDKETIELWEASKSDLAGFSSLEEVFVKYGYPVELYIIDYGDTILAKPEQIGWYDEGEHSDELRDIELKDINDILQNHEGFVEIEIDEWYETINVTLEQEKVIIRAL